MPNPQFSDALAASGFVHRASLQGDGSIIYRCADGSGDVLVPHAEWHRLGQDFQLGLAPIRKRTKRLSIGLAPATFLFGVTLAQLFEFGGAIILAAILLGPLTICIWHAWQVRRIACAVETELAAFPACVATERDARREPRWLEIAIMALVGPHLVISLIGEIGGADFFRGTPLWGSGIGPLETVAFALIALRAIWPRIGPQLVRAVSR